MWPVEHFLPKGKFQKIQAISLFYKDASNFKLKHLDNWLTQSIFL